MISPSVLAKMLIEFDTTGAVDLQQAEYKPGLLLEQKIPRMTNIEINTGFQAARLAELILSMQMPVPSLLKAMQERMDKEQKHRCNGGFLQALMGGVCRIKNHDSTFGEMLFDYMMIDTIHFRHAMRTVAGYANACGLTNTYELQALVRTYPPTFPSAKASLAMLACLGDETGVHGMTYQYKEHARLILPYALGIKEHETNREMLHALRVFSREHSRLTTQMCFAIGWTLFELYDGFEGELNRPLIEFWASRLKPEAYLDQLMHHFILETVSRSQEIPDVELYGLYLDNCMNALAQLTEGANRKLLDNALANAMVFCMTGHDAKGKGAAFTKEHATALNDRLKPFSANWNTCLHHVFTAKLASGHQKSERFTLGSVHVNRNALLKAATQILVNISSGKDPAVLRKNRYPLAEHLAVEAVRSNYSEKLIGSLLHQHPNREAVLQQLFGAVQDRAILEKMSGQERRGMLRIELDL